MTTNLYQQLLDEFKNDIDFRVESLSSDITEQICEIMGDKNLNRVDLSDLLNTSKAAVTKMLNGSTNFTLKRLLKIADVLEKELSINFEEPAKTNSNRDFNSIASTIEETTASIQFGKTFRLPPIKQGFFCNTSTYPTSEEKMTA